MQPLGTLTETQFDVSTADGIVETDSEPVRDTRGRFTGRKPGPGRPRGCSNRKTLDALALRERIVTSWDEVDGDRLLVQLAKENPLAYLQLVAKLLPQERKVTHLEQKRIVFNVRPVNLDRLPRRDLPMVDAPRLP